MHVCWATNFGEVAWMLRNLSSNFLKSWCQDTPRYSHPKTAESFCDGIYATVGRLTCLCISVCKIWAELTCLLSNQMISQKLQKFCERLLGAAPISTKRSLSFISPHYANFVAAREQKGPKFWQIAGYTGRFQYVLLEIARRNLGIVHKLFISSVHKWTDKWVSHCLLHQTEPTQAWSRLEQVCFVALLLRNISAKYVHQNNFFVLHKFQNWQHSSTFESVLRIMPST